MSDGTDSKLSECRLCGAKSAWAQGFVTISGFIGGPRTICVTCWLYDRTYRAFYGRWVFWTVVVVLAGYYQTDSIALALQLALALYGVSYVAVVAHELGHALTAVALGFRVPVLSLGGGIRAKGLVVRNTFVLLGPSPVEGHVVLRPPTTRHYRKKMALILLAGSLTNLILAGLALSAEGVIDSTPVRALAALVTAVNLLLVLNLLPWVSRGTFGQLRSDGLQLLELFKLGDAEIEKRVSDARFAEALVAFHYGAHERAYATIAPALAAAADLQGTHRLLATAVLINAGKKAEGIELTRTYLGTGAGTIDERAILMNNLACALVDGDGAEPTPATLAEADELTTRAMEVLAMTNGVRATRAAVLIEKGAYREACELLSDKRFRLDPPWVRAIVKSGLAVALAGLGERVAAAEALREASRLSPGNAAVQRARERAAHLLQGDDTALACEAAKP
jgi:hypothetical protein